MRLFVDTNIFMEFVEQRRNLDDVSLIFDEILDGHIPAYISTGCIYTLAFLFEKSLKAQDIHKPELTERLRDYLAEVLDMSKMVELSYSGAKRAVRSEAFTDIEDSFQYQCAIENRCDVLLTINTKDFKNADQQRIEILNPSQFVKKYMSQDEQ